MAPLRRASPTKRAQLPADSQGTFATPCTGVESSDTTTRPALIDRRTSAWYDSVTPPHQVLDGRVLIAT